MQNWQEFRKGKLGGICDSCNLGFPGNMVLEHQVSKFLICGQLCESWSHSKTKLPVNGHVIRSSHLKLKYFIYYFDTKGLATFKYIFIFGQVFSTMTFGFSKNLYSTSDTKTTSPGTLSNGSSIGNPDTGHKNPKN